MSKFSTYLLVMFMILFWIIRIIVTVMAQIGKDYMGMVPMNKIFEIAILFATLVCVLMVAKRNIFGSLIYLAIHAIYFGGDVTSKIGRIINGEILSMGDSTQMIFSMIGIILPVAVLLDLLLDKNRKANPRDGKTDWFFRNKNYDRKLDERADKNNYRTM